MRSEKGAKKIVRILVFCQKAENNFFLDGTTCNFFLTDGDLISKQNGGKQILSKKNKLWGGGGDERSLAKDQNPIDFFGTLSI